MTIKLQNLDLRGYWEDTGITFHLSMDQAEERLLKLIKDDRITGIRSDYRLLEI